MPAHLDIGRDGEEQVARYLLANGYRLIQRNARMRSGEIDIIAYDKGRAMTVFVEVKTRTSYSDAYPIRAAVDAHKRRCMKRAIAQWCARRDYDGPGRTDVVCVSGDRIVEHLMDVGSDFF